MTLIKKEYINTTAKPIYIENTELSLMPVSMPKDYAKEWNVNNTDFLALCKNGKIISDSYYRKGGMFTDNGWGIIHIIKYVEAYYDKNLTEETRKNPKSRKHLAHHFCLINSDGVETKVFDTFERCYLIEPSVYVIDYNYYNSFTNEKYCESYHRVESADYLFLQNDDKVMKINKKTGEYTNIN